MQGLGAGRLDCRPVFIVGMPRSGTTLVEQILASHPEVLACGESRAIPAIVSRMSMELGTSEGYPQCIRMLEPSTIDRLSDRYLDQVGFPSSGKKYFTDKLPHNYFELGLITILFPQARIVYCKRDPLDTCLSCYFQNFQEVFYANDLKNIAAVYHQHEQMMAHWREVLTTEIFEVEYEKMVGGPEPLIRALLDYCDLPWHPGCLEFHRTERMVRTASAQQVKLPIYTRSVRRWKNYEKHLGELIACFNGRMA